MHCKVYHDLILLYTSEECTEETKQLVEEHLKGCLECKAYYQSLNEPITEAQPDLIEAKVNDFKVKKSILKIRKRIFLSLIAVIIIIILGVGGGFMTYNQVRGEGICFTNLDEISKAKTYFRAIKQGDYEKAYSMMDIKRMYNDLTIDQLRVLQNWTKEYHEVKVGTQTLYVNDEVYNNDYRAYKENKDEAAFWANMLIYNSEHRGDIFIPKEVFDAGKKLVETNGLATNNIKVIEKKNVADNKIEGSDGFTYVLTKDIKGDEFYVLSDEQDYITSNTLIYSMCLPQSVYEQSKKFYDNELKKITACSEYYKKMGYHTFRERLKKVFVERMKDLETKGIKIKNNTVRSTYYMKNDEGKGGSWTIVLGIKSKSQDVGEVDIRKTNGGLTVAGGGDMKGEVSTLFDALILPYDIDHIYPTENKPK